MLQYHNDNVYVDILKMLVLLLNICIIH